VPVAGIRPQWPEDRRTAQYGQNACLAFSFATSAVKAGGAGAITPAPPRTGHVSSGSANYIRVIRAPQPERLRSRRCAAPPTPEGSAARCSRVSVPAMAFAGAGAAPLPLPPCLATMLAGQDAGDATGCSACAPLPARPALSAGGVGLWATTGVSGDLFLMVVPRNMLVTRYSTLARVAQVHRQREVHDLDRVAPLTSTGQKGSPALT
jgi:hypothetical protein